MLIFVEMRFVFLLQKHFFMFISPARQEGLLRPTAPSARARGIVRDSARALTTLWSLTLRSKATIGYSEDRGTPEIVLESPSRSADEATRVRPHVDLVAAVASRLT